MGDHEPDRGAPGDRLVPADRRERPEPMLNDRGQLVCPFCLRTIAPMAYDRDVEHCAWLAEQQRRQHA